MNALSVPLLRYYGGKSRIARWICEVLESCSHIAFVDVFGGAGNIIFNKRLSELNVYNDISGELVSFMRVMRDDGERLKELLQLTPFSREEYRLSFVPTDDPLEAARRLYVRSWQAYSGQLYHPTGWRFEKTGARGVKNINEWKRLDHLSALIDLLRKLQIENDDWKNILKRYDASTTLFYFDPPYLASTRNRRNMKSYTQDGLWDETLHAELAEALHALKGKAVISHKAHPLYFKLYEDWEHRAVKLQNTSHAVHLEYIWIKPGTIWQTQLGI